MEADLKNTACFGVAGNFTGHLEQAGEAADFTRIKTAEADAPKAVFPTYLPGVSRRGVVPAFLETYPFDARRISFPHGEQKLQIEPELAIICRAAYRGGQMSTLQPLAFGAANDCSIRKAGARKISEKKNWGPSSKGLADNLIDIDRFDEGGILNRYRIASYLLRGGEVHEYGEDSPVRDYSYFYGRLIGWLIDRFNNQSDEGPGEPLRAYLEAAGHPEQIMVSVGATRYTAFGESNFLQGQDVALVVIYPEDIYTGNDIRERALHQRLDEDDISVLAQEIITS